MQSANPVKNCGKRCTVIHYVLTENEQEMILTHTIIESILTPNYISPSICHLQAISSTVKSHNHSTFKKTKQKAAQTAKKKKKSKAQAAVV